MGLLRLKDPLLRFYSYILSDSLIFSRLYQMPPSFTYCPSLQFISIYCTLSTAPELQVLFCWLFAGLCACLLYWLICLLAYLHLELYPFKTASFVCILIQSKNTSFAQQCAGPLGFCNKLHSFKLAFKVLYSRVPISSSLRANHLLFPDLL